jgi:hypothetical protein
MALRTFKATAKLNQRPSFSLPRFHTDDKVEAAFAHVDMGRLLFRTDEMYMDRALDAFPEASAATVGDEQLEPPLVCADMHTLLLGGASASVEAEQAWLAGLVAAYSTIAADDKSEAALPTRADAQEHQDMVRDALDDQYEATLAKADMHALQRNTDAAKFAPCPHGAMRRVNACWDLVALEQQELADSFQLRKMLQCNTESAEFAPGMTVIDTLDVAGSWLDGNQLLKEQKTGNDLADQMSNCSTAVPSMDLLPVM